jgi:hypothetical protein
MTLQQAPALALECSRCSDSTPTSGALGFDVQPAA